MPQTALGASNDQKPPRRNERGNRGGNGGWWPAGLGLRPWAALMIAGLATLGMAGAMWLTNLYRAFVLPQTGTPLVYDLTLQFIPHPWREIGVGGLGLAPRSFHRRLSSRVDAGPRCWFSRFDRINRIFGIWGPCSLPIGCVQSWKSCKSCQKMGPASFGSRRGGCPGKSRLNPPRVPSTGV